MLFADRLNNVETSAIRELFKLLGKPGIISFAGGFPDPALFDVEGIRESTDAVLKNNPGPVLQYGATEGYQPLREGISLHMAGKGATVAPDGLIVTTGSQQALDLIGKTMISPGDKVIMEAPTFLATIQCFRLYGAQVIGAPIDAHGVDVDKLEALIEEHKPKLVYLIPSFGNPSGAMLSLERRKRILEIAARTQTLVVEDDPYGELFFDQAPPPSLLALSDSVPGSREWLVGSPVCQLARAVPSRSALASCNSSRSTSMRSPCTRQRARASSRAIASGSSEATVRPRCRSGSAKPASRRKPPSQPASMPPGSTPRSSPRTEACNIFSCPSLATRLASTPAQGRPGR